LEPGISGKKVSQRGCAGIGKRSPCLLLRLARGPKHRLLFGKVSLIGLSLLLLGKSGLLSLLVSGILI
jgi:hypothetical protein